MFAGDEPDQFGTIADSEFRQDGIEVCLDRLRAEDKGFVGDLAVGATASDCYRDAQFVVCEQRRRRRAGRRDWPGNAACLGSPRLGANTLEDSQGDARCLMIPVTLSEEEQAAGLFERRTECTEFFGRFTENLRVGRTASLGRGEATAEPHFDLLRSALALTSATTSPASVTAPMASRASSRSPWYQVAGVEHLGMQPVDATKVICRLGVATRRQRQMAESRQAKRLEHSHTTRRACAIAMSACVRDQYVRPSIASTRARTT